MAQNRTFWIKHPSTHTFPDMFSARETNFGRPEAWLDAVQMGPQCGGDLRNFHDGYFGFCPAKSQLYRGVVKLPQDKADIARIPLLADARRPANRRAPPGGWNRFLFVR